MIINRKRMKKTILMMAMAAMSSACFAQHTVTVKMSDLKNDSVFVMLVDKSMRSIEKTDTIVAKKGTFTYDVQGDKTRYAMVRMTNAEGKPAQMAIYLVPGEKGVLKGTTEHAEWSGSKFYTELCEYEKISDPLQDEMSKLGEDYQKQVQAGGKPEEVQAAIMPKYQELAQKMADETMNFIKTHPGSDVSATLLSQVEDQEAAITLLTPEVKSGKMSEFVASVQARIDAEKARKEAAKGVADGCVAPDFTLKDINGNDLALSSLRGKYLILDFWGSWCGWCIKGFPEMKEYYKKYAGKFEILGVDCNDTEDKWKAAVEKNELPWKHVYNPRTSDLTTKYAIEGFPTKIVIDPEGKIAKTIVGEDPAFYQYLDELFK